MREKLKAINSDMNSHGKAVIAQVKPIIYLTKILNNHKEKN